MKGTRNNGLMLAIGVIFGFALAFILIQISGYITFYQNLSDLEKQGDGDSESDAPFNFEDYSEEINLFPQNTLEEEKYNKSDIVARNLAENVRVLCWVMTGPQNHKTKAIHVKRTWGQRCNKLLFVSSENDTELGAIKLNDVKEGRDYLWAKTKGAFKYVYENHFEEYDRFLKADDDTYVILENLRYFLKDYDTNYPIYFGCRFKPYNQEGYMTGGPGYVLSKEALKRFIEQALPDNTLCRKDHGGGEDVEIAYCMQNIGVEFGDTRDALGRYRFNNFIPETHLIPGAIENNSFYWSHVYYPQNEGMECCSDYVISFHYVPPSQMYVMEYLIYHVKPYGINYYKLNENEFATKSNKNETDVQDLVSSANSKTLTYEKISNLLLLLLLILCNYCYIIVN